MRFVLKLLILLEVGVEDVVRNQARVFVECYRYRGARANDYPWICTVRPADECILDVIFSSNVITVG